MRHASRCNTVPHSATQCNTLQHPATPCIATHGNTLQHTATLCTATHCNTLQHTATHCNTLQHTATQYACAISRAYLSVVKDARSAYHFLTIKDSWSSWHTTDSKETSQKRPTNMKRDPWLHHTAPRCKTLQHTATHCNTRSAYHCFRNNMSKETYKYKKRPITTPHCMPCIQSAPIKSCHLKW